MLVLTGAWIWLFPAIYFSFYSSFGAAVPISFPQVRRMFVDNLIDQHQEEPHTQHQQQHEQQLDDAPPCLRDISGSAEWKSVLYQYSELHLSMFSSEGGFAQHHDAPEKKIEAPSTLFVCERGYGGTGDQLKGLAAALLLSLLSPAPRGYLLHCATTFDVGHVWQPCPYAVSRDAIPPPSTMAAEGTTTGGGIDWRIAPGRQTTASQSIDSRGSPLRQPAEIMNKIARAPSALHAFPGQSSDGGGFENVRGDGASNSAVHGTRKDNVARDIPGTAATAKPTEEGAVLYSGIVHIEDLLESDSAAGLVRTEDLLEYDSAATAGVHEYDYDPTFLSTQRGTGGGSGRDDEDSVYRSSSSSPRHMWALPSLDDFSLARNDTFRVLYVNTEGAEDAQSSARSLLTNSCEGASADYDNCLPKRAVWTSNMLMGSALNELVLWEGHGWPAQWLRQNTAVERQHASKVVPRELSRDSSVFPESFRDVAELRAILLAKYTALNASFLDRLWSPLAATEFELAFPSAATRASLSRPSGSDESTVRRFMPRFNFSTSAALTRTSRTFATKSLTSLALETLDWLFWPTDALLKRIFYIVTGCATAGAPPADSSPCGFLKNAPIAAIIDHYTATTKAAEQGLQHLGSSSHHPSASPSPPPLQFPRNSTAAAAAAAVDNSEGGATVTFPPSLLRPKRQWNIGLHIRLGRPLNDTLLLSRFCRATARAMAIIVQQIRDENASGVGGNSGGSEEWGGGKTRGGAPPRREAEDDFDVYGVPKGLCPPAYPRQPAPSQGDDSASSGTENQHPSQRRVSPLNSAEQSGGLPIPALPADDDDDDDDFSSDDPSSTSLPEWTANRALQVPFEDNPLDEPSLVVPLLTYCAADVARRLSKTYGERTGGVAWIVATDTPWLLPIFRWASERLGIHSFLASEDAPAVMHTDHSAGRNRSLEEFIDVHAQHALLSASHAIIRSPSGFSLTSAAWGRVPLLFTTESTTMTCVDASDEAPESSTDARRQRRPPVSTRAE